MSSGLLLEIVEGPDVGRRLEVDSGVKLGRETDNPVALGDEQVSRYHASVTPIGESARVEDLGSLNGTFLNDSPVESPTTVRIGDRIRVGLTVLELRREGDTGRGTVATPVPRLTQVGADVLRPAATGELVEVPAPRYGAVVAQSTEPKFVASGVARRIDEISPATDMDGAYGSIGHLVDSRVKRQTSVMAFAFIAIASLAVIIYFGVT